MWGGPVIAERPVNADRFVTIHGHFYQPPRENPWLEAVEIQDSAAPYHDWNERVTRECYAPNTCQNILRADRQSAKAHGGHGNAIAQVYNHRILPLATRRDKFTQVQWGRQDFQARFGRDPEGMWLPETAVDNESLEILTEAGMKFTILAPHQAWRIRKIGTEVWEEVNDR